jgi:hypothetical protein
VLVYGRSLAGIVGLNPTMGTDICLLWVLSGRGLSDELITRSEESYQLWCAIVCDLETFVNEEARAHCGGCRTKTNLMKTNALYIQKA